MQGLHLQSAPSVVNWVHTTPGSPATRQPYAVAAAPVVGPLQGSSVRLSKLSHSTGVPGDRAGSTTWVPLSGQSGTRPAAIPGVEAAVAAVASRGAAALTSPRNASPNKGLGSATAPLTVASRVGRLPSKPKEERPQSPAAAAVVRVQGEGGSQYRGGLAARAAACTARRGSCRRGSSLEGGPRMAVGACERSLSVGVVLPRTRANSSTTLFHQDIGILPEDGPSHAMLRQKSAAAALFARPSSRCAGVHGAEAAAGHCGGACGGGDGASNTGGGLGWCGVGTRPPGIACRSILEGTPPGGSGDGSSTVPLPTHPHQHLHTSRPGRLSAPAVGSEPEAEPASAASPKPGPAAAAAAAAVAAQATGCSGPASASMQVSAVAPGMLQHMLPVSNSSSDIVKVITACSDEPDPLGPNGTLNSACVDLTDEGQLQLCVRLLPSELLRWADLRILRPVSTGSFGEVYLARYRGRDVSVKRCILSDGGTLTKEQLHNLEREINTYRTLDHPQIVKYIGCVLEHPNLAIITEYVPNGNVFDLLYSHRVNLPAATRLKIASQVALALNYMHSCDPVVIHRDLKTQNLVLDADYSVKLCDFGKSQPMIDGSALPPQEDNGGSPRYMAPECFQAGSYITEKVDIWSLGCCLVEVFGGPLPYEDVPQMSQVVVLILRHRQPPLVPPWFVQEVQPMLAQCFDFEPQRRLVISEVQLVLKGLVPEDLERHGMNKRRTR